MNEWRRESRKRREQHAITETLARFLIGAGICIIVMLIAASAVKADYLHMEWYTHKGKSYWFENNQVQGAQGDPKNITDTTYGIERGREIYDPESNGWYWLDACYAGARAENKEVWFPYVYQSDLKTGKNPDGKWVIYDGHGAMIKGWLYRADKDAWYHYDMTTGAMAKGRRVVGDGGEYIYKFDKTNGWMVDDRGNKIGYTKGWAMARESMKDYETYYTLDTQKDGSWLFTANTAWPKSMWK
jgi:hypothetical protein